MVDKIEKEVYEAILENAIISAIDVVVYNNENKILLAKRTQEPCKGEWWILGGRQFKGELPEKTAVRKIKEEVGLDVEVEKLLRVEDVIFDETAFPNVKTGVHYVVRIYLAKYVGGEINLDDTQSEYKWIDEIDDSLDPYIKRALKASGIFK